METIKSYLENVFSVLPKTAELINLKSELENNMLDKYHELKQEGKSENEAIGIVISEFGNIDELLEEMNISITTDTNHPFRIISLEDAQAYIKLKKKVALYISFGVALILFSVASLISMYAFMEAGLLFTNLSGDIKHFIPIIFLLICIAISVSIFIISDHKLEPFKCIEDDEFTLSDSTLAFLNKDFANVNSSPSIILGVILCILSPVAIFIGVLFGGIGSSLGVSTLLLIIACAVFIFIYGDSEKDSYQKLLHLDKYASSKKDNPVISAVSGIIWPIAVCIFLLTGLVWNLWYINWIVFPITGILFGGFCACYNALHHK